MNRRTGKLILSIGLSLMLGWGTVMAEVRAEEEIPESETPQANRARSALSVSVIWSCLLIVAGTGLVLTAMRKQDRSRLYVSDVQNNDDGTATVVCCYHSSASPEALTTSNIKIRRGSAIIIEDRSPSQLKSTEQITAILDQNTELEIKAGGQRLVLNQSSLKKIINK